MSLSDFDRRKLVVRESSPKKTKFKPRQYDNENGRWWTKTGDEQYSSVSATLSALEKNQRTRMRQAISCGRLYGNLPLVGAYGLASAQLSSNHPAIAAGPVTYNVVQIATDTATSAISKNRPKPYFLTSGGSYSEQRTAKQLNKLVDGVFYHAKMNNTGPLCFRDGAVFGTGVVHIYASGKKIEIERILPHELWVDETEAERGDARQLHYTRNVDKDVLAEKFPECKDRIFGSSTLNLDNVPKSLSVSNMVTVRESWHLPSGDEADDGRHILTLNNCVLNPDPEEQKWEKDHFPFAFFRWNARLAGFWGQGAVEQTISTQLSINQKCWYIQRSHQLGGTFKIWLEVGSNIVEEHITNDIGSIGYYVGAEPHYVLPPMVQPEIYEQIKIEAAHILEAFGVSQMASRGAKPAGLVSGEALREYKDEANERLTTPAQNYEQFVLDTAALVVETATEIKGFSIDAPGSRYVTTIDMPKNLDSSSYTLQCFPISALPREPAGRLQTITEHIQAGFMTRREGKRLLDFPDLEKSASLANAAEDYLYHVLDDVVDNGVLRLPESYDDLDLARELALEYYEEGKNFGLAPERLEQLRTFMAKLDQIKAAEAPPPAPGGPGVASAGPGTGLASPIAPPQTMSASPLVPQSPPTP
jgi:hypothetical protein